MTSRRFGGHIAGLCKALVAPGISGIFPAALLMILFAGCSDNSGSVEQSAQAAEPRIIRRTPASLARPAGVSALDLSVAPDLQAKLPVYEIKMAPEQLARLESNPYSQERLPAAFSHDGVVYENVAIRYRGAWARTWPKKPLKLFFDGNKMFRQSKRLNLNSAWRDPSFIRETLAYRIYAAAGCPASTSRLARVHFNGEFRGLYVEVEQADKEFLKRRNLNGATIFKASSRARQGDERDLGNVEMYKMHYEQETQKDEPESFAQLHAFCRDLASARNVREFFEQRVDLEKYVNYLAATVLCQNWDGYNKNHFIVYDGKGSKKWYVLPWDLDRSLGDHWDWSFGNAELPIDLGTRNNPGVTGWNRLMDAFYRDATLRARLSDRIEELIKTEFTEAKLYPVIDQMAAEIAPEASLDRRLWPNQDPDVHGAIEGVKQYIKDRRAFLLRELPRFRAAVKFPQR